MLTVNWLFGPTYPGAASTVEESPAGVPEYHASFAKRSPAMSHILLLYTTLAQAAFGPNAGVLVASTQFTPSVDHHTSLYL